MPSVHCKSRQRYGYVAESDGSNLDTGEESDEHAEYWSTLKRIQVRQRQTTQINTWTCWCIRAAPILATVVWLSTLITLLFAWIFVDKLQTSATTAFPSVSDVVARHATIALFGAVATAILLFQSLSQERILRFRRVLVEATDERWLWHAVGTLDCFLGLCAGVSLFLLPIFDSEHHRGLHEILKATFFVSFGVSGLLNAVEVEHLWHEHPDRHDLRVGTFLKYTFLSLFVACGVTSRLLYELCQPNSIDFRSDRREQCYRITTASTILEWVACFSIAGLLTTLALDVWPISRHVPVHPRFSASSQRLTHVHLLRHDDDDHDHEDDDKDPEDYYEAAHDGVYEIPPGQFEIRRLPMMTRPARVLGYGNGWTDSVVGRQRR